MPRLHRDLAPATAVMERRGAQDTDKHKANEDNEEDDEDRDVDAINQAIQGLEFGTLMNRRMAAAKRFKLSIGDAKQEWVRSLERHEELNVGALAASSPPPQASQPKSDEDTSASSEQQVSTERAAARGTLGVL